MIFVTLLYIAGSMWLGKPITATDLTADDSGSVPAEFFTSVALCATASRAISLAKLEQISLGGIASSGPSGSK